MSLSKIEQTIDELRDRASCNNQCLIASGGLKHTGLVNQVHLGKMFPMNEEQGNMHVELYHIKYRSETLIDENEPIYKNIINTVESLVDTSNRPIIPHRNIPKFKYRSFVELVNEQNMTVTTKKMKQNSPQCKISMGTYNVLELTEDDVNTTNPCKIKFVMHETNGMGNQPIEKYMYIQHNIGSLYHDDRTIENIGGYSAYSLRNVLLRFYYNTQENQLELDARHVYGGEDGFVISEMFVTQLFEIEADDIEDEDKKPWSGHIGSIDYSLHLFQLVYDKSIVCSFYHSNNNKLIAAHVKVVQQKQEDNNIVQCKHINELLKDEKLFKSGKKYHWFVHELCQKSSQLDINNFQGSVWAFHICCKNYSLSKPGSEKHPQLRKLSSKPVHFTKPFYYTPFWEQDFRILYENHAKENAIDQTQFTETCAKITDKVNPAWGDRQWVECREDENDIPFIMECLASMPNHDGRIVEKFVVGNDGLQQKPKFMLYKFTTDFLRNQNLGALSSKYRNLLGKLNTEVLKWVKHVTYVYLDNETLEVTRIDYSPTMKDDHVGALMCAITKNPMKGFVGNVPVVMFGHNAKFTHKKTNTQKLFDINARSYNRTKIITNLLKDPTFYPKGGHPQKVSNLHEARFWNFTIGFVCVTSQFEIMKIGDDGKKYVDQIYSAEQYRCYLLLQGHSKLRQPRKKWVETK